MNRPRQYSRRVFLSAAGGLAVSAHLSAAGDKASLPVIPKRVEKAFKVAGAKEPNDLQFVAGGLWVLDQVDPNPMCVRHCANPLSNPRSEHLAPGSCAQPRA